MGLIISQYHLSKRDLDTQNDLRWKSVRAMIYRLKLTYFVGILVTFKTPKDGFLSDFKYYIWNTINVNIEAVILEWNTKPLGFNTFLLILLLYKLYAITSIYSIYKMSCDTAKYISLFLFQMQLVFYFISIYIGKRAI